MAVRMAAETLAADFVFIIMEAWGLPRDKMPRMDAIIDKYGSIAACPYRLDMTPSCWKHVTAFGLRNARFG